MLLVFRHFFFNIKLFEPAECTRTERQIDRSETPTKSRMARLKKFGELIGLHIDDLCDVGKSPRRSKAGVVILTLDQLYKLSQYPR